MLASSKLIPFLFYNCMHAAELHILLDIGILKYRKNDRFCNAYIQRDVDVTLFPFKPISVSIHPHVHAAKTFIMLEFSSYIAVTTGSALLRRDTRCDFLFLMFTFLHPSFYILNRRRYTAYSKKSA